VQKTLVRTVYDHSSGFEVKVGMQGYDNWRTPEASVVYVAEMLVVIQYNVLVVTSWYTRIVVV